ncbi:helix-turn-helix domain-containing protein [Streptomyces sp. NPDC059639]|uniref:helix-turn-helix domain-containing protein n=1 Tax=Streptomyces sp. NPDC059639 TaxID=3346891 RepID=UPI0036A1AAB1
MIPLASAGGNRAPVIAQLVAADEDTVRDVIHRLNETGLACLDPRWAGGRSHLLNTDDEDFVIATATTRPAKLGQPFTRWSIRRLCAYLRTVQSWAIRMGREALRCLLARRGITFQHTKTWKESTDPERDTKLDRIEYALENLPDRVFAFDEFGPLGICPTAGFCWAQRRPDRIPANCPRTHGVTCFHGCYSVGDDTPWGVNRRHKGASQSLSAHKQTRALHRYLGWRNTEDILAAQRRERARIRSEMGIRSGRRASGAINPGATREFCLIASAP